MQWKRIFKRKRWLLNIPTILWQVVWEFTKDTIIEVTRNYFVGQGGLMFILDYLLQNPIIIVFVVAIIVFIWAYVDTRREKGNDLKIVVQRSTIQTSLVYNPYPSIPTNLLEVSSSSPLQKKTDVIVTAKFTPIGKIKIENLKLHIGGHSYKANELPALVLSCIVI